MTENLIIPIELLGKPKNINKLEIFLGELSN